MNETTKDRIRDVLITTMDRTINRRVVLQPFDEEQILLSNPFGGRLVPMEIWKGAKFERSFVTSLGQSIFESIAAIIATGAGAIQVNRQHIEEFNINTFKNSRIDDILNRQRNNTLAPDWEAEVAGILLLEHPDTTRVRSTADLFIERPDGRREYYSLKTVKPNLDQTEIAKRDMLRLKAFNNDYETYFGLPFNPAGEGNRYGLGGHRMPYKIFQMDIDECVLIGSELWNKIGNDPNTYTDLLEVFEEVGEHSSERIRREYLEIE
jgi:hypothetical protein